MKGSSSSGAVGPFQVADISRTARAVVLCSALAAALGCGQKGPLYLPDHNGSVVTRPAGGAQNSGTAQPATQQPPQAPKADGPPAGTTGAPAGTTGAPAGTPRKDPGKDDDSPPSK
jgi:predicted small lipoprotein YifL